MTTVTTTVNSVTVTDTGATVTVDVGTLPALHAASHASGGSDPVTLAESQVTGLTAALAGKLATPAAWTAFTPTVTASSGTFTSASASGAYAQLGKVIICRQTITIVTNGTAGGAVLVTYPVTPRSVFFVGVGRETAVTGAMQQVFRLSDTNAAIQTTAGGYPGGDGRTIQTLFVYEAA